MRQKLYSFCCSIVDKIKSRFSSKIKAFAELFSHYKSYSQDGEDMIVRTLFILIHAVLGEIRLSYADIGAYQPILYSNTYFFYKQGLRGINIDATPGSMELFKRWRKEDINIEIGIGMEPGIAKYYQYSDGALNTFREELAMSLNTVFPIIQTTDVEIATLSRVFEQYLPEGTELGLLDVDCEGLDLDVLRSNDWSRFRPFVVLAEACAAGSLEENLSDPIPTFLKDQGYSLYSKTIRSFVFIRDDILDMLNKHYGYHT